MKRLTWVYLTGGAVVGFMFALTSDHPAPLAILNASALVAIAYGIRRNRLPVWPCWGLIGAALFAWTVAVVWISLLPHSTAATELPSGLGILLVAPFAALGSGIIALLRRQRETIAAPLVDVAMITVAASLLLIEFGLELQLIPDLIVLALSFRLLIGSSQPPAGWLLLGGIGAGVISDFVFMATPAGRIGLSSAIAQGGWVLARSAIAAAALHPSSVELMRRRPQRAWPPLAALGAAVGPAVAVPLAIAFHARGNPSLTEDRAWALLLGSSVLVVLAFLRVGLMIGRNQDLKRSRSEEHAKFRALVDQLPVATYIDTLEEPATTVYMSDQIVDLTGFLPEEFISDPGLWDRQVPESHRALAQQALRDHKASGEALSIEYPFERRDRSTVWLGHRARLVRDQSGRPLFTEGVLFDVTDAKEREKPVLHKMRVLHAVFESAPIGVATMSSHGELLSVNPALERMLGYSLDELREKDLEEVISARSAGELRRWLRTSLKSGGADPLQAETELFARNGDTVWANVTLLSLSAGDDGDPPPLCLILEDVTERRRSRLAFEETAEQLETVISNLPVVLVTYGPDRRLNMVTGRGVESFGLDADSLIGRSTTELLDGMPEAMAALEDAYRGRPTKLVADFQGRGGWWEVWYSPMRDPEGEVAGVLCLANNVSDRMDHEQAVERSLSLLNTTFDSIADAVVATDLEGEAVTYNRQFPLMWGVDPEEWAGWDPARRREHVFAQTKQPADVRSRVADAESDPHYEGWFEIELKNGRVVESRVVPQKVNDEVIGRVVSFHDVTEQRRSTALMQDQARILKDIARAAPLDAVLTDLCRTVAKYNDGILCSICIADDGAEWLEAASAPGLERFYEEVGRVPIGPCNGSCGTAAFHGERVVVGDVLTDPLWTGYAEVASRHDLRACWSEPIRSSEGSVLGTFAIYATTPRVPNDDEIRLVELFSGLAAVAIERDLAVQRRQDLENRLHQVEKMQSVGRLARGFAHDLGNVLAAIGVNADLLRPEVTSEQAREALRDLEKATLMAGNQVNDLLNLMRPPYPELVDLNEMVRDMASLLRSVVRDGVTVDIQIQTSPACVEVDVSQFHQVLLNLVLNASHAISDQGVVTIRVSEGAAAGWVLLTVEDDGIGMDAEIVEQAFEPYFTTTRQDGLKGVGLGLTSASSAVAAVGGLITLESEPDRGTKVSVHLPVASEETSEETTADEDLVTAGGSEQ